MGIYKPPRVNYCPYCRSDQIKYVHGIPKRKVFSNDQSE